MTKIHSIWSFLSDKTICGELVKYKYRPLPEGFKGEDKVMENIALELDDITCPECKEKAHAARTA